MASSIRRMWDIDHSMLYSKRCPTNGVDMSASKTQPFYTVGQLAQQLTVPVHRITYLLNTRRITPTYRAGRLRLYSAREAEILRSELASMDRLRTEVHRNA
jgi:hypothetical protein